jgi:hypothetical protein
MGVTQYMVATGHNPQIYEQRQRDRAKKLIDDRIAGQDGAAPWDRLPDGCGESDLRWGQFQYYLGLGPSRSLAAVAAHYKKTVKYLRMNASIGRWAERAVEYDRYQSQEAQSVAQEQAALEGKAPPNWHSRSRKVRQDKYNLGSDILSLARERIDRAIGVVRDDNGVIVGKLPPEEIEPMKVQDKDWPQLIRIASALQSESIQGEVKPVAGVDEDQDEMGMPKVPTDLSKLTHKELEQYLGDVERFNRRKAETNRTNAPISDKAERTN